jgi:hypothetical protein
MASNCEWTRRLGERALTTLKYSRKSRKGKNGLNSPGEGRGQASGDFEARGHPVACWKRAQSYFLGDEDVVLLDAGALVGLSVYSVR